VFVTVAGEEKRDAVERIRAGEDLPGARIRGERVVWLGDRAAMGAWYRRNRARSRAIFDLLAEDAYYSQPIALRHPIVFYEGHLPAFSFNTLVKKGLGRPSIDPALETLFARGIDPDTDGAPAPLRRGRRLRNRAGPAATGSPASPMKLTGACSTLVNADVDVPGHPLLDRAEAVFTLLERGDARGDPVHVAPVAIRSKRRPAGYMPMATGRPPASDWRPPAGRATLGADRGTVPFGWDNEFRLPCRRSPFAIERHGVANARFLEFRSRRLPDRGVVTPRTGSGHEDLVHRPLFWEREGDRWCWRDVRAPSVAAAGRSI
jgi:hypothetical protein